MYKKSNTFAPKTYNNMLMKKVLFLLMLGLAVVSCKTQGTIAKSTQGTHQANKVIKGEWTLSSVTYNEKGKYEITLLNDTSKECFEGSYWKFVPNNYRGIYAINNAGCAGGDRHFIFTVQEIDKSTGYYDFLLKPTNEKYQSETNAGVRLHLAYLSENEMRWEQTVRVDGKPFVITMNFTKN